MIRLKTLFALVLALSALEAPAQTVVNQGTPSSSAVRGWRVQGQNADNSTSTANPVELGGRDATGKVQAILVGPDGSITPGTTSAGETTEVCITNAAGGTTLTNFTGRRGLEIQNGGPNAIYCTIDGTAPLATGANGRKILAATSEPNNVWALVVGDTVTVKCIAATAAQTTPACSMITEVK